jgi:translation initiation factor 2 alpha subunit (eIF-2alpha)
MKTIDQRLQSRISKRRNFIRFMEEDVAYKKASRHAIRGLELDFDHVIHSLNEKIHEERKTLKQLADDQKLDKQLKNIMLERAQLYGIRDF